MNNLQNLVTNKAYTASYDKQAIKGVIDQNKTPNTVTSQNNALMSFQQIKKSPAEGNQLAQALTKATEQTNKDSSQSSNNKDNSTALSDERCKELFGSRDILDAIADIDAYRFKYKPGMESVDPNATPDKTHTGIMAQDLAAHPETSAAVEEDPLSGFLKVNTKELTMTTFALVTEIAKRLKTLEEIVLKKEGE